MTDLPPLAQRVDVACRLCNHRESFTPRPGAAFRPPLCPSHGGTMYVATVWGEYLDSPPVGPWDPWDAASGPWILAANRSLAVAIVDRLDLRTDSGEARREIDQALADLPLRPLAVLEDAARLLADEVATILRRRMGTP